MLRKSLTKDMGFHASEMDPCLFICKDCVIVLCVDDAIVFMRNDESVAAVFKQLEDSKCKLSEDTTF